MTLQLRKGSVSRDSTMATLNNARKVWFKASIALSKRQMLPATTYRRNLLVREMSTPAVYATSQNVAIPVIPELYDAGFLDSLLPVSQNAKQDSAAGQLKVDGPSNPMIDALKATTNRTLTDNLSPAFSSTGSACLDAFQGLQPYSSRDELNALLTKAWKEDPELTLRMIWSSRSIHDGKGDRETFYR